DDLDDGYLFSEDCILEREEESAVIIAIFGVADLSDPYAAVPFKILSGTVDDLAGSVYTVGDTVHLDANDILEIVE
ncbi:hypothetical protein, partial [Vibrio cholerae]